MKFEEKLVKLRKQRGMSQEEVADKLNVSRQAVSRWELGTTLPDAPNLLAMSELFGVSIDYLLHDDFESDDDIPKVIEVKRASSKKSAVIKNGFLIGAILWLIAAICNFVVAIIDVLADNVYMSIVYFGLMAVNTLLAVILFVKYVKQIKRK